MPKKSTPKTKKTKKVTSPKTDTKKVQQQVTTKPAIDSISKSTKTSAVSAQKTPVVTPISSFSLKKALESETTRTRVYAVLFGALFVVITLATTFIWVPNVVRNTDDYKAIEERDRIAREDAEKIEKDSQLGAQRAEIIADENTNLVFENRSVTMTTNFGDLVIDLSFDSAPLAVDNFVRLTSRGFYADQSIHRMVETNDFNVIQGGQAVGDQSSEAALGGTVADELWEVAPEFEQTAEGGSALANEPQLSQPAIARDFDAIQGTIVYPKGTILMAKTSQPDSATTQFFITLTDTTLPAEYTAFGTVRADNFGTLDTMLNDVDPQASQSEQQAPEGYKDGEPEPAITYTIKLNDIV
jgi:cyclophilin family peptidyl-prolyl cis-trans isomerase